MRSNIGNYLESLIQSIDSERQKRINSEIDIWWNNYGKDYVKEVVVEAQYEFNNKAFEEKVLSGWVNLIEKIIVV